MYLRKYPEKKYISNFWYFFAVALKVSVTALLTAFPHNVYLELANSFFPLIAVFCLLFSQFFFAFLPFFVSHIFLFSIDLTSLCLFWPPPTVHLCLPLFEAKKHSKMIQLWYQRWSVLAQGYVLLYLFNFKIKKSYIPT